MGFYTVFSFRARLKKSATRHREIIKEVIDGEEHFDYFSDKEMHPFFKSERADFIVWGRAGIDFANGTFNEQTGKLEFTCELKNYDDDIEKFCDWIKDAIDTPKKWNYIGWKQGEYGDRIYFHLDSEGILYYDRLRPVTYDVEDN